MNAYRTPVAIEPTLAPEATIWNGGGANATGAGNGRNHRYHRNGYYGNGGGGYYGMGKRSHYDNYTRRQHSSASANRTTSGEGADTGGTTINDDEYTRITTPRQDVLFKKGYLSRPKPSVATASTSNTGSSSLAGTTSEGSDGGNGGSNSISTTESITSEYGGSYAADGSQLFDYSIPCIPCGYFTETGVLVMNGFAVDNKGFSYFNGGQTYIYPPNYNNCLQSPTATTTAGDETTDSMLYANDNAIDETDANDPTDLGAASKPNHSPVDGLESSGPSYVQNGDIGGDGSFYSDAAGLPSMEPIPVGDESPEQATANGGELSEDASTLCDIDNVTATTNVQEVPDYSQNGYFPYTNGYDFAQFYNSLCYPNWVVDQCRLYDDAGLPLYCGGDYALTSEEAYGQQSSFKKRKKRFRTFEEVSMPLANGNTYDVGNSASSMVVDPNTSGSDSTECVPENQVPSSDAHHQPYQLNAEVQEFQPSVQATNALPNILKFGDESTTSADKVDHSTKGNVQAPAPKQRSAVASKVSKSSSKVSAPLPAAVESAPTTTVSPVPVGGKPASNKANRKKDLIESTLAFAAQNIDLTRPKAAESVSHDSDLCWTTIDRNGRKKRIATEPEQESVTASGKEKESSAEEPTNITNGEIVHHVAPAQVRHTPTVQCPTLPVVEAIAPDVSGKKEQQIKSKKKTQKHKRQQGRKSIGNFSKQPQEGFQVIEPEFSSPTVGQRRGRSGDKAGRNELAALKVHSENDAHNVEDSIKSQSSPYASSLDRAVSTDGSCHVVVEKDAEPIKQDDQYCDKESNDVPAEMSLKKESDELQVEQVIVAQKFVPTHSLTATMDETPNINETETEMPHQQSSSADVEEIRGEEQEQAAEVFEQEVVVERSSNSFEQVVAEREILMEEPLVEVGQEAVPMAQEPNKLDCALTDQANNAANAVEKSNAVLASTVEEQQTMDDQLSIDTHVLVSAAKQLTLNSISPPLQTLAEGEAEDPVDATDDGIGSEGDETRPKRGSVSGAGYTESIDSGLQSPAPCGGVASPEASSMVSSIESQSAEADCSQSALSQVVGSWLLQKLEVHEPEEVFVLPSNPLLIQRLERFHQLQRRERRERLRGAITSESEGDEDDEYDLDGEDTDSDYMSDGQGRLDRTQSDDASSFISGSPLSSTQQVADKAPNVVLHEAHTEIDSSAGLNSVANMRRAADSKRCSIM
uniref:Uncharacterized protein n=1 Tax=Anopheles epiroticus TaxID=199890 RepID=A0A182PBL6_9DIPT